MSNPVNPYAHFFTDPAGPGDGRPTALQIIEDNNLINSWAGRTVLITGGSGGIGLETARAMHATGADVFITARTAAKGDAALADIRQTSQGKGRLRTIEMELSSLASVRAAAASFLQQSTALHILINNAGIMAVPHSLTEDGHESQFAINHLAHFLLTSLLLPTLLHSSTPSAASRVINVSSSSHRFAAPSFTDLNLTSSPYDPQAAYGASKTAQIWHANELERRHGAQGLHALSLHPGGIYTGLTRHVDPAIVDAVKADPVMNAQIKSAAQGAATTVWAAVSPAWESRGGVYLCDCATTEETHVLDGMLSNGYAPFAFDEESERRLWDVSVELTTGASGQE